MLITDGQRDEAHRRETLQAYARAVSSAMEFIEAQAPEAPLLEEIARHVGFSRFHFHRIFRAMVGETLADFTRRVRLQWAAQRLMRATESVTRVAVAAGYGTPSAFTRAFRQCFGITPTDLRSGEQNLQHQRPGPQKLAERWLHTEAAHMDVEIRELPGMTLAFVRHLGPYPGIGRAFGELCEWAGPKGVFGPHTRFVGIFYDSPELIEPEQLRADACMVVPEGTEAEGQVGIKTLEAGRYAVAQHKGPYDEVGPFYDALFRDWLPGSGESLRDGPSVEIYLNDPHQTPPEDLLTDVCVPIE